MEITLQALTSLFLGLKKIYMDALSETATPEIGRLVYQDRAITTTDEYPASGLLGDLEEHLDELHMINMWEMLQRAKPILFDGAIPVKRLHILNDQIGVYENAIRELGEATKTHPYRNVARCLMNGFTTVWLPDGQNIFSNDHAWPGGQGWDNLEHLPLTAGNFDIACQHLEMRARPDGQPLGMVPRLLLVGPLNRANAETIIEMQLIGGGNTNRQYKRCELLVEPRINTLNWFVIDDERPPIVNDLREGPATDSQISNDSDHVFTRNEYRFKAWVNYVLAILQPWRIQASDWEEGDTTTTAA